MEENSETYTSSLNIRTWAGGFVFPNYESTRIRIWIRKKNPELYYFIKDLKKFVEKVQYLKKIPWFTVIIFKYKDNLDFKQISSHFDIIFNKEITIYSYEAKNQH